MQCHKPLASVRGNYRRIQARSGGNLEKLNQRVNELIGQGWQLYGSPAVKGDYWAQAMVKPREPIKRQANVAYSRYAALIVFHGCLLPFAAIATLTALCGES